MVIRLDQSNRRDINDLKIYMLQLLTRDSVTELLLSIRKVPKISRDNTNRRIVVGINVRNRDLQSVVTDIQKIVNTEIKPPGYYVQYGGQFENLQSAKARLMVAVPLALFLILILLYFAWINKRSFNGVFSNTTFCSGRSIILWMRGLPFSISGSRFYCALVLRFSTESY
jgi:cobalt-zinc-cadmium resistance protein CzcA